jgi:type I restriction enzyme S subunit
MKTMENQERTRVGQHQGAAMKKGWKTEPLGELCDIRNGSTPSKGNPTFWDGGTIPWFTIDDMREQGREISSTRQKITKSALSETSVKLLPEDSVLLCCTASVGEFAITRIPLTTNQQFNGLVVKNRNQLDPNFLFHYVSTLKDELLGLSGKTTIDFIPISRLRDVAVPVPPLAEQRRIVGLLDEAFEGLATAKANAEKNLQNARALFESHLQSVFTQHGLGWVEKRLDAVAEFSQGIQVGLGDQSNAPAKGLVRFIRISDYTQGTDDIRYVQDPGRRYWADKSDIVMVRYGTPGLVGRGIEGVIANNLFKISILDGSLTKDFLAYFLSQQAVQTFLSSQGSSTMPALTFTQLGAVVVSFPRELEIQNTIVSKLDDLREETQRLARLYERKLAALEALKKSLLHQAFTGAL